MLVHRRIGNVSLVALLRAELEKSSQAFDLILSRVVCDGIHAGDFIATNDVIQLQFELERLSRVHSPDPSTERFLRNFEQQMSE
jgi:hypothetical protein